MRVCLPGSAAKLGTTVSPDGVNFAVFSEYAQSVELCLFSNDGLREEQRIKLPERSGSIWHGFVPGLQAGALYGYRVYGDYLPEQGHRFNPNKLLLDPYTRELSGAWQNSPEILGFNSRSVKADLSFDNRDSAPFVPKSVVSNPALFEVMESAPYNYDKYELIYEAHVKGFSQMHPDVPDKIRGSYEGMASDAMIDHLLSLNVSAIELLPVHSFIDDGFLAERGLRNYWGYNSIAFFAPEPRYLGPAGLLGFKEMVQRFKGAGIDVILDVVYNHTAEGDQRGPTFCYRGLDNHSYYRLQKNNPRYYVNDTGCGNTLNVSHPFVLRMVLDSLRFWVQSMGISGFRFDLATTIAREADGFNPRGIFLNALRQDPILANVRLIAEPWDIGPGGYQLGGFPHPFSEWNDAYRDGVRKFWRNDPNSAQELGARLLGSADRFDSNERPASASINILSSHDGFTLADVTQYNKKHNDANTENNIDGHGANYSDNCGVEGPSVDPKIMSRRARRQRNMLATLFLSQGVPMMLGGDEIGNSQDGNNNAYCQDNSIGWINWGDADHALNDFVKYLSQLRKDHPVLYQKNHLHGEQSDHEGLADVEWQDYTADTLDWNDPELSKLCLTIHSATSIASTSVQPLESVCIVLNRSANSAKLTLPVPPQGQQWKVILDTSLEQQPSVLKSVNISLAVQGDSIQALVSTNL